MKMNMRQIFLGARLLVRLCLPATVFIGLCTGIFVAFIAFLQFLGNITRYERFFRGSWLLLFIFYIIVGVALIRFNARLIHSSFGSEELRVQRHMASLSGSPFYIICLLFLMIRVFSIISDEKALTVYLTGFSFFLFSLASCGYFLLIRFFLGRLAIIAQKS